MPVVVLVGFWSPDSERRFEGSYKNTLESDLGTSLQKQFMFISSLGGRRLREKVETQSKVFRKEVVGMRAEMSLNLEYLPAKVSTALERLTCLARTERKNISVRLETEKPPNHESR